VIGHLRGTVRQRSPDTVILDVGGVGYEVHIPVSTFYEIERAGEDATVSLHIHTHLRDDGLSLFGFWTEREKRLFQKLLGVGGIGPKLARVILSGMAPADLLDAIVAGDIARLSSIPGVGKKTAQRMALELKDKVRELVGEGDGERPAPPGTPEDDLVSALVNLGYKPSLAARAVSASRREQPDAAFPELLRLSLKKLSRA
jgi:holliday junction DNA helicase RuvA